MMIPSRTTALENHCRTAKIGEVISKEPLVHICAKWESVPSGASHGQSPLKDSDFSTELQNILDEQFNPDRPNTVWCSDITYIWTIDGFVYLTSIMDLFSRKIIA